MNNVLAIGQRNLLSPPVTAGETGPAWQAWPARQPFVDDVTRPWPSDDWPGEEPTIVIEAIDRSMEVIDWRAVGGALDMVI